MGKLLDWVKLNVKDGANLAEFEELERAETVSGLTTKEQAADYIKKNPLLTSALDSAISTATAAHDEKFKSEKLPEILKEEREKLQKELNPEETPIEKELRENREALAAMKAKDARRDLEDKLRGIAKELGYPEDRAARFAIYGENAEETIKAEAEFLKSTIKAGTEKLFKDKYGNLKLPEQHDTPEDSITREDFNNLSPAEKSKYAREGGKIVD